MDKKKPECYIAGWGASNTADSVFYLRAGVFKVKESSCPAANFPTVEDVLEHQLNNNAYFVDPAIVMDFT